MRTLYRYLLRLYPAEHRTQFGEEMIEVLREVQADLATRTRFARVIFCLREATGLLTGAIQEHLRSLGAAPVWLSIPTKRFTMRAEFRFPKATAVLMTIILAGVILAIERGEAIVASFGTVESPHFDFLPAIAPLFVFVHAAGVIGWAILFALRRSGVHRLETSTEQE